MKKENLIAILGGVIFLAIGLVITFNVLDNQEYESNDAKANLSDKANNNVISSEENKVDENNTLDQEIEIDDTVIEDNSTEQVNDENKQKEETNDTPTNQNSGSSNNDSVKYSDNDNQVINSLNDTLNKVKSSEITSSFKDSAKATFISIVDFLFYDGKINGVTFDELTEEGKSKVLEIASNIDNAIEEKIPGYKDTISAKASEAFNKASELIKKGANNLNDFAKEKLGEENYQSIIDAKDDLVYYTKNAINFIGDVGSNLFNSAKDKLNNWYQNFKNNN